MTDEKRPWLSLAAISLIAFALRLFAVHSYYYSTWNDYENHLYFGFETALPFLWVLLFYPLVFYFTHPTIRYRHVIDPEIAILAALGLRSLLSKPSARALSLETHI